MIISRQKVVGWVLVAFAVLYILYFLKVRVVGAGPALEKADWIRFIGSIVILMLGTANVRLAAMREEKQKMERRD